MVTMPSVDEARVQTSWVTFWFIYRWCDMYVYQQTSCRDEIVDMHELLYSIFVLTICFALQWRQRSPHLYFLSWIITDHESPELNCPVDQTCVARPKQTNTSVAWTDPQGTDNSGQNLTMTCDAESGGQFGIGLTTVTCQAVDPSGNKATCMFTVKIKGNGYLKACFLISCRGRYKNHFTSVFTSPYSIIFTEIN